MSFGEGLQEYLKMGRLTQRRVDRSDNNVGGKTPWFDASMTPIIGSMFEHRPSRYTRTEFNAQEINVNQRVTWLGTHQRFWRG